MEGLFTEVNAFHSVSPHLNVQHEMVRISFPQHLNLLSKVIITTAGVSFFLLVLLLPASCDASPAGLELCHWLNNILCS